MRYGIRGTGYAVCCTHCEVWVMCLEIWIMRIEVSNVVSECCWRARVPVKWHLADFDFDFWHEKSI